MKDSGRAAGAFSFTTGGNGVSPPFPWIPARFINREGFEEVGEA